MNPSISTSSANGPAPRYRLHTASIFPAKRLNTASWALRSRLWQAWTKSRSIGWEVKICVKRQFLEYEYKDGHFAEMVAWV
jgi:hypothetical protein